MKFYKSLVGKYFLLFSVIPALIICILLAFISTKTVYNVKVKDTEDMLRSAALELVYSYELLAADGTGFRQVNGIVYAGDYQVTDDYSIVDRLNQVTDVDLSLFYMDTRIITTLFDENGNRYVNTKATDIWNDHVQFGEEYFTESIDINGQSYFGYYIPVRSSSNIIIGMGFAGKPSQDIHNTIRRLNALAIIICICLCIVTIVLAGFITRRILKIQKDIMTYIDEIDRGNFNHKMPEKISKRNDEYGIMGRSFISLNDSLRNLIQNDALTGLFNRRAAMNYLNDYVAEANNINGETFTFAIGDIDLFKKVNDTYGHNCGDEVLRRVSAIIGQVSGDEGFACRWGGEEFVIAFKGKLEPSLKKLETILDEIRDMTVEYNDYNVKVTMTFGITEYVPPYELDKLISNADVLLYKGKESGRNQIVS